MTESLSAINLGNSVRDFTKSDPKEFTNVVLTVDDEVEVKAKYAGNLLPPLNKWKSSSSVSGAGVTIESNYFSFYCGSAITNWQVKMFSNPSIAKYRQLVGKTIHVSFTVNGFISHNWRIYAGLFLQPDQTTDFNRLYYKDFPYASSDGTYTYDVVVGGEWFNSSYADGWLGMDFHLYSTEAGRFNISNITVTIDEDDAQNILVASCPWANTEIAEQVSNKLIGFVYRPFDAKGARLTPLAELGDTVIIDGDGYDLISQESFFDSEFVSDISSPNDEELEHEFEYVPSTERRFTRELRTLKAEIDIQADAIEAKVSSVGGNQSSFGWRLENSNFTVYASNVAVLKVTSSGAEITGKVVATSGEIGGCKIVDGRLDVSTAHIGEISADQITAGYIDVKRIKQGSLDSTKLSDGAVIESKINTGAVTVDKIGSGAVTGIKIGGGAVTTAKLGDGAVTMSKMSSDAQSIIGSASKLFGRDNGYGTFPRLQNPVIYSQIKWQSPSWGGGGRTYILGVVDTKPANAKYVVALPT